MPLFDEGGKTGASKQSAWEEFTGLFGKERKGKSKAQPGDDDDDDDQDDQDGTKPLGKKAGKR